MTKPKAEKSDAAERFLMAARAIAGEKGCSGLRIRDVAGRAGLNLGLFHYHFRNKKNFTQVLLQEMYEDFFTRLSIVSRERPKAIEQLEDSLLMIGAFIRDERKLFSALIKDLLNGDPEVLRFARKNVPRHASVFMDLLKRCHREKSLPAIPFPQAMGFIMGALNVPTLVASQLECYGISGTDLMFKQAISDKGFEQRVQMIISGLKAWHA